MIFEKQVVEMYKGMMYKRCDDTETVHYFSPADFSNFPLTVPHECDILTIDSYIPERDSGIIYNSVSH